MTSTTHDVVLRFLSEQAAQQKTEQSIDALNKKLEQTEKHGHEISKFGTEPGLLRAMEEAAKAAQSKLNPSLEKTTVQIRKITAEARLLQKQASEMVGDVEKARIAALRQTAGYIEGIGKSALLIGGATAGGIFALAKNYIKDAEQSNELTQRWAASTKEIEESQARIGQIAAQAVLPTLEKAADIASKVAGFVESHPEIVEAAFNTGLLVAGFGTLATAVSKGIKLFADIKYLATIPLQLQAAQLQEKAAEKQLLAASLRAKSLGVGEVGTTAAGGVPAAAGGLSAGGIASKVGAVTLIASSVLIGIEAGTALGNAIAKAMDPNAKDMTRNEVLFSGVRAVEATYQKIAFTGLDLAKKIPIKPVSDFYVNVLSGYNKYLQKTDEFAKKLLLGADEIKKASDGLTGLAGSENASKVVSAFQKWKEDDARIVEDAAKQRTKIMADAAKAESDADTKYAKEVESINTKANKQATSIITNFRKQDAQDEASYQTERAKIIKEGGKEIRSIEQDHQERLRKMSRDHDDRMDEFTAARDALGLVKEQRRFNQERDDENRSVRLQIAKQREDLAMRLQELDGQHKAEQAQRLAQFQEDLKQNAAQRQEELTQAAEAHAEEMNQIRSQRTQQLRELQEGLNAERLRRRETFIAEIRDLDASLLGERNKKQQYYNLMLQDADKWLAAYRAKLAGITTTTNPFAGVTGTGGAVKVHDFSGYTVPGIYRMSANGQPEYVLSGAATRAAENMIGGRLTQDALLSAIAQSAGGSSWSVFINDHSRFDGRISAAQVRQIKRETKNETLRELGLN